MNKVLVSCLIASIVFASYQYNGSTTGVVTLVGGTIKAKNVDNQKKYKRKDCPVCKGQGWYWSGDGIKKVDCGYCEPEQKSDNDNQTSQPQNKPDCKTKVMRK